MTNLITNKLDTLIAYSTNQRPLHSYDTSSIVQDYKKTVSTYFSRDRSSYHQPLHELQIALYCDIQNRNTKYKAPPVNLTYASDYPPAYNDLRKLFYNFQILNCDTTKFFSAWKYDWIDIKTPTDEEKKRIYWRVVEIIEDDDGETKEGSVLSSWDNVKPITVEHCQYQKEIIIDNTLLSSWIDNLNKNGTAEKELANVSALNSWLCKASADAYDLMLWEEMGEITEQPKTKDIAKIVFTDKKLKECKELYNLPVHIPTYMA